MPTPAQLPAALSRLSYLNAADVSTGREFDSQIERLIRFVDRTYAESEARRAGERPAPSAGVTVDEPNLPAAVVPEPNMPAAVAPELERPNPASSSASERVAPALARPAGEAWWLQLLRGVCAVLVGIAALYRSGWHYGYLEVAIVSLTLADALAALVASHPRSGRIDARGTILLLQGATGLVLAAGIVGDNGSVAPFLLWALIAGALEIGGTVAAGRTLRTDAFAFAPGGLKALFGLVAGAIWISSGHLQKEWLWLFGFAFGAVTIAYAFRLRSSRE
jgi:hypothetical protein